MYKIIQSSILISLASIIIACAGTPTQESTGQYLDSAAITAKVKAKLVEQLGTKGFGIKVKTYKDEVQLSGFVDNDKIKRQAGNITSSLKDVRQIRNDLVVK